MASKTRLPALGVALAIGAALGFVVTISLPGEGRSREVPLWVEVFHRLCTAVGGLGTLAALLYVVRQFNLLRQQSELLQKNVLASIDGQLYTRLDAFNRLIVEHEVEYEMLDTVTINAEKAGHRAGLHHLCDLGFSLFEQVFKLRMQFQLLEAEDWEEWRQRMAHFFGKAYVRSYWKIVRVRYAARFQEFADSLANVAKN